MANADCALQLDGGDNYSVEAGEALKWPESCPVVAGFGFGVVVEMLGKVEVLLSQPGATSALEVDVHHHFRKLTAVTLS